MTETEQVAGRALARTPALHHLRRPPVCTRQQVLEHLLRLGFAPCADETLTCAAVHVTLLDAPRLLARSPYGSVYLVMSSASQLEEQLTSLLGYQRPPTS